MFVWFWIIGWFLTVLAVTGNALVIWLVTTKRRLRTTANFFIVSLAIADFCIGLFSFPALFTCKRLTAQLTARLTAQPITGVSSKLTLVFLYTLLR